ncbi:MAG: 2-C-methyl-D-erythritol 4-phosphate cytidylyltransferase [Ramlibacter sp.]|jgi:2-C-methyl-D-erythritol 4-phosphate cytidylyltransferase|uniref:2-C-methyl-D-erythritol 4-phosphate cytidylyltransferase n=1 Tax=Ramlibacter sp. TaxID=1917967 RepID=UPI0026057BB9|nr:2-C-methyl-D-erythritol 4-phosphate cytidylyltransferase [Ramlibacter sp.]MDB5750708.1 2-C-methyl-D-erythritol 4-phosphate cytidylyltransferase [Ramlibacter sp.]
MNGNAIQQRYFALIPCAGNGSRAGTSGPKQYERVAGQPMVWHTLSAFAGVKRIARTLVVVAASDGFFERNPTTSALVVPCGGATRAASVANGLRELRRVGATDADWVLVHDAARCLVTPDLIDRLIDRCSGDEVGGLLAHPLADTLKIAKDGRAAGTLQRDDKWLAQTPQMFRLGMLRQALEGVGDAITDEAGAIEAMGLQPLLVEAGAQNFKVTYPEDFAMAEAVLRGRAR